jgi:GNAT superfamily N-acetyltransferase
MTEPSVRFASPADLEACVALDQPQVPVDVIKGKIERREILLAEGAGALAGYLRLEYLWSMVPFLGLIWVVEGQRRQGVGKALLGTLEDFLRERGHGMLYSSSQADEPEPQAWHRHVGFEECGFIGGINEGGIGEVFFRRRLDRG